MGGFLWRRACDCSPRPLGLCVTYRGSRSSSRHTPKTAGNARSGACHRKLSCGLVAKGWRVELILMNHRHGSNGSPRCPGGPWGQQGLMWWAGGDPWALPEQGLCKTSIRGRHSGGQGSSQLQCPDGPSPIPPYSQTPSLEGGLSKSA